MISAGLIRATAVLGLNVQHAVYFDQVVDGVCAIAGLTLHPESRQYGTPQVAVHAGRKGHYVVVWSVSGVLLFSFSKKGSKLKAKASL